MKRKEALQLMRQGVKITHHHFMSDEWMSYHRGKIITEEGYTHDYNEFWSYRKGQSWEHGYSVFVDVPTEENLVIGARIRIGEKRAESGYFEEGQIIELIEGHFEYDNGLYTEDQTAPSMWDGDEFSSIYHMFGNDFENWEDCSILIEQRNE